MPTLTGLGGNFASLSVSARNTLALEMSETLNMAGGGLVQGVDDTEPLLHNGSKNVMWLVLPHVMDVSGTLRYPLTVKQLIILTLLDICGCPCYSTSVNIDCLGWY